MPRCFKPGERYAFLFYSVQFSVQDGSADAQPSALGALGGGELRTPSRFAGGWRKPRFLPGQRVYLEWTRLVPPLFFARSDKTLKLSFVLKMQSQCFSVLVSQSASSRVREGFVTPPCSGPCHLTWGGFDVKTKLTTRAISWPEDVYSVI